MASRNSNKDLDETLLGRVTNEFAFFSPFFARMTVISVKFLLLFYNDRAMYKFPSEFSGSTVWYMLACMMYNMRMTTTQLLYYYCDMYTLIIQL